MDTSSQYPDFVARFYDLIYHNLRHNVDHEFYEKEISRIAGPVLEIGVGTGRLFCSALNKGADIYGVDNSPAMLDVLKAKISPENHHRLYLQNITRLDLPKKFDLIVAPFRVFSHLIEVADQLSALEAVKNHLKPGGEFIMDLFVPDPALITLGMSEKIDFEGEYAPGFQFKRTVQVEPDRIRQINHVTMGFSWETENGWKSEKWVFPMRYFFRNELEQLIARAGFQLKTMYGDFEKSEFNAQSKEYVIVCSRGGMG